MENNVIDEAKIEEFIRLNDKRIGTELDKHRDLIVRLMGCEISRSKIYEFIFENDKSIPSIKNFYKYIDKRILNKTKSKKIKSEIEKEIVKAEIVNKPTETAPKTIEIKKEDNILSNVNKSATQNLSEDFDLLAGVEMGSLKK